MLYKFDPLLFDDAHAIAQERQKKNAELMKATRGSQFDRGVKGNFEVDYKGILGELIARDYLETSGIEFQYGELIQDKPVKEADITINGLRYDVKAKLNRGNLIEVNKRAHEKGADLIDAYWFVNIDESSCAALFKTVYYDDVSKWRLHYYEKYKNHAYQSKI